MTTYASAVKTVASSPEAAFDFLSDLSNLKPLYARPDVLGLLKDARFDTDSCQLELRGLGAVSIRVVERVPCRAIHLKSEGLSLVEATVRVQLEQAEAGGTHMQLILQVNLPYMLHIMVGDRLQKGLDHAAEVIARQLDESACPPAE